MAFYWLVFALLLLVVEMGNPGLFLFLSFSCSALIASGTSWLGYSLMAQGVAMLLGSILSYIILKYWVKARLLRRSTEHDSNVFAMIGKKGIVIKDITQDSFGQVKIDGQIWSARPVHNQSINMDTRIEVVSVKGAHVVVKEYNV